MTSINLEQEEIEMTAFDKVLDEQIDYAKHHLNHIKGLTDGMSKEVASKYTHKAEVQLALIEAIKKAVEHTLPLNEDYSSLPVRFYDVVAKDEIEAESKATNSAFDEYGWQFSEYADYEVLEID